MNYSKVSDDALKYALLSLQKEIFEKAKEYIERIDPGVEADKVYIGTRFFFNGLKIKLELVKK